LFNSPYNHNRPRIQTNKRMPGLHSRIRDLIRGWLSPNLFDDFIFDFGHGSGLLKVNIKNEINTKARGTSSATRRGPQSPNPLPSSRG